MRTNIYRYGDALNQKVSKNLMGGGLDLPPELGRGSIFDKKMNIINRKNSI